MKHVEVKTFKNRKGISINFKHFGLCVAILNTPRFTILKKEKQEYKGYYIAIHRLVFGFAYETK